MRADRLIRATAVMAGAGLAVPAGAGAHAIGGVTYQTPVPTWLYVLAGAAAVAVSVPAAAYADARIGARRGRNRYAGRGWAVPVGRTVTALLLVECILAGLFGKREFTANPATVLIWVDFWVGLGLASALAGPVWDVVNPLRALGALVARSVPEPPLRYPAALGQWPCVALLLLWGWLELSWPGGGDPLDLALVATAYVAAQMIGMTLFGPDVWLARAELFTAVGRIMARVAPLEWYVTEERECPAGLHPAGAAVGCSDCWLASDPGGRGIRWRGFVSGTWRDLPLQPGGAALVVCLLAVVLYDGFSETNRYTQLAQWIYRRATWLSGTELRTATMAACVAGLVAAFALAAALLGRRLGGMRAAGSRIAPTLMPIVAVYFAAHYLLYLLTYGQLSWKTIVDPLETDWVPDLGVWTGYPGAAAWGFQVTAIVLGHIVAVFAAHRVMVARDAGPVAAVRAQVPLVALMVAYTVVGLWILGQAYAAA
jgi:hypothetical protein